MLVLIVLSIRHINLIFAPVQLPGVVAFDSHRKRVAGLAAESPEDHEPESFSHVTEVTDDVLAGNAVGSFLNGNGNRRISPLGRHVSLQLLLD